MTKPTTIIIIIIIIIIQKRQFISNSVTVLDIINT